MGVEWDDEDSNRGQRFEPKLTLAGRLEVLAGGQPLSIVAEQRDVVISIGTLRTLVRLRRNMRMLFIPMLSLLRSSESRLLLRLLPFGTLELYPRPNAFVRLLLPKSCG